MPGAYNPRGYNPYPSPNAAENRDLARDLLDYGTLGLSNYATGWFNNRTAEEEYRLSQQARERSGLLGAVGEIGLQTIPIYGDIVGLGNDIRMYNNDPSSRTWENYMMSAASALPLIPSASAIRGLTRAEHSVSNIPDISHPYDRAMSPADERHYTSLRDAMNILNLEEQVTKLLSPYRFSHAGIGDMPAPISPKSDSLIPQFVMNEGPKNSKGRGLFGKKGRSVNISAQDRKWGQIPESEIKADLADLERKYASRAEKENKPQRFKNQEEIEKVIDSASVPDIVMPATDRRSLLFAKGNKPGEPNDTMVVSVRKSPSSSYVQTVMKMEDEQLLKKIYRLEKDGRKTEIRYRPVSKKKKKK